MSLINDNDFYNLLKKLINNNKPFYISRLGGTDWQLFVDIYNNNDIIEEKHYNTDYKLIFKFAGYYDKSRDTIKRKKNLEIWYKYFKSSILCVDHCTVGGRDYGKVWTESTAKTKPVLENNIVMSSFGYITELTTPNNFLLNGYHLFNKKKILIISPFGKQICDNYNKNKDIIFENFKNIDGLAGIQYKNFKYPEFKSIDYIELYITNNNTINYINNKWVLDNDNDNDYYCPHNNFNETILEIQDKIKDKDFDIALIGGGIYTQQLGYFIKNNLKKGSIYTGGALQCYFGIIGRRYIPKYKKYFNKGWVIPDITNINEILINKINKGPTEAMGAYFTKKYKINIFGGSNTIYKHSYSNLLKDNYEICNYGIGGTNSVYSLIQMSKLKNRDENLIIIEYFCNDLNHYISGINSENKIKNSLYEILNKSNKKKLLFILIKNKHFIVNKNKSNKIYNIYINFLFKNNISYIDTIEIEFNEEYLEKYYQDTTHLNNLGMKLLKNKIIYYINNNLINTISNKYIKNDYSNCKLFFTNFDKSHIFNNNLIKNINYICINYLELTFNKPVFIIGFEYLCDIDSGYIEIDNCNEIKQINSLKSEGFVLEKNKTMLTTYLFSINNFKKKSKNYKIKCIQPSNLNVSYEKLPNSFEYNYIKKTSFKPISILISDNPKLINYNYKSTSLKINNIKQNFYNHEPYKFI